MYKLPPTSLYRVQTLAQTGPCFYKVNAYVRHLEALGLIAATGRTDPAVRSAEYRITDAGRAELEQRYGPLSTEQADEVVSLAGWRA